MLFSHPRAGRKQMSDINVVPYIDVMLVLLIVFMVTAPLLTPGVPVALPEANAEPLKHEEDPLVVSVDKEGNYYLNISEADQPKPLTLVQEQLMKVRNQKPNIPIFVEADESVNYVHVIQLLSALQSVGIQDVGLVTQPESK